MKSLGSFILLLLTIFIISCNDQDTEAADRDAFIGEYEGELACAGLLGVSLNGTTTFNIDESSMGTEFVDITILTDPILRLESTVDGKLLMVSDSLPQVMTPLGTNDIIVTGDILLSSSQDSLTGELDITLMGALPFPIQDKCAITGVKK